MKKTFNKLLAYFLVIALVIGCITVYASAENLLEYNLTVSDNTITNDTDHFVTIQVGLKETIEACSVGYTVTCPAELAIESVTALPGSGFMNNGSLDVTFYDNNTRAKTFWDTETDDKELPNMPINDIGLITIRVPADTPKGNYDIAIQEIVIGYDYSLFNHEDDGSLSATITVEEPSSPYEIYYTLNSETDELDEKKYMEYAYNNAEDAENQVEAEIILVSNDADMTLQAYDIYLTYSDKLSFNSYTGEGTAYKTVAGATDANAIIAAEGDKVTHIQAVGGTETTSNDTTTVTSAMTPKSLAKGDKVSLGTIVFDIASTAVHDEELEITLVDGTSGTQVTNVALAQGLANAATGDKKSYYPVFKESTLGAEVNQEYTVTFVDGETELSEQTVGRNLTASVPEQDPTKANHTFAGWYADAGFTTPFDFENTLITGDTTVYANFTQNTFTVTWYDAEGNKIYDGQVEAGTTTAFDSNNAVPQKAADEQYTYTFKGWAAADSLPEWDTEETDLTTYTITADTKFYPVYTGTVNKYTIKFVNDDGEVLQSSDVEYGTLPAYTGGTPQKTPTAQYTYTFEKWTPDIVEVTGPATYTAAYTETVNKYTITWKADTETELRVDSNIEYGSKLSDAPTTSKVGYVFKGWIDKNGNPVNLNTYTVEGNDTLTAQYTPNTFTVKFNANGGSGTMADQEFEYGVTEYLTLNSFTHATKNFDSWNTMQDGSGTKYADGADGSKIITDGEITLYAQWSEKPYRVTTTGNNGEVSADKNTANKDEQITVTVTPSVGYEIKESAITVKTDSGTTVENVNVTENSDGTYTVTFAMPNESVTVNAAFTAIDFKIEITNPNTGKVVANKGGNETETANYLDQITLTAEPNPGYKWSSFSVTNKTTDATIDVTNDTFTMPASDVAVTADFVGWDYQIKFNANGGNNTMGNISAVYGTPEALTPSSFERVGYTFIGWATSADGEKVYDDKQAVSIMPTKDNDVIELFAVWQANEYTVTLDYDYDVADGSITVKFDGTYDTLKDPATRTGYNFVGWYLGETKIETTTKVTTADAHTLVARWTAKDVTVTLSGNEGQFGEGDAATKTVEVTIKFDSKYLDNELPEPNRPGYDFVGWKLGEDDVTEETLVKNETEHTLTAQWELHPYTISFNLDGGAFKAEDTTDWTDGKMPYNYESTDTLPTPEREYYVFTGWKVEAAEGVTVGNWGQNGTEINDKSSVQNKWGDVTLAAQWDIEFTYAVEDYKYAPADYAMLRIATDSKANAYTFKLNETTTLETFYTEDDNYKLTVTDENGNTSQKPVFVILVPKTYVDGKKLSAAGMENIEKGTAEATTIQIDGNLNGDDVLNIADANVVYQMVLNGGGYYDSQLDDAARLEADMYKTTNGQDGRASIADVNKIVNMINGVTG